MRLGQRGGSHERELRRSLEGGKALAVVGDTTLRDLLDRTAQLRGLAPLREGQLERLQASGACTVVGQESGQVDRIGRHHGRSVARGEQRPRGEQLDEGRGDLDLRGGTAARVQQLQGVAQLAELLTVRRRRRHADLDLLQPLDAVDASAGERRTHVDLGGVGDRPEPGVDAIDQHAALVCIGDLGAHTQTQQRRTTARLGQRGQHRIALTLRALHGDVHAHGGVVEHRGDAALVLVGDLQLDAHALDPLLADHVRAGDLPDDDREYGGQDEQAPLLQQPALPAAAAGALQARTLGGGRLRRHVNPSPGARGPTSRQRPH